MLHASSLLSGWRLLTLLTLVSFGAQAQHRPAPPHATARTRAARPLADVLTPNGQLRPGASGAFDPTGYRLATNPATGQPAFQLNRTTGAGDEDWQGTVGTGLDYNSVSALAVAPNGDLYVGGSFSDAGNNPAADFIFRWDGTQLQTLGTGLNGSVSALVVAPNGDVFAGGSFNDAGGNPDADGVARWDGTAWQALGTGVSGGNGVSALALNGGSLYVAGSFYNAGGVANADDIARWDGTAWQALGGGLNIGGYLSSVAVRPNGDVYVGGYFFDAAGNAGANYITYFDGANWQRVGAGAGLDGDVQGLSVAPNGDVVAVGYFSSANGNPNARRVARWTGTTWQAMGTGVSAGPYEVLAASNGDVYIAGFFTDNTNTIVAYTSRWNGTSWQTLNPDVDSYTYALAEAATGDIWHGGSFTHAGTTAAPFKVARWNGASWSAPAIIGLNGRVNAVVVSGPDVYVGGLFSNAGGNPDADHVARWDGYEWHALGAGLNNQVHALALAANGDVLVGGDFSDAGGNPDADKIARWDGTSWQAFGTGIDGGVYALAVAANADVWVGGFFTDAGGNPAADNVARWDGTTWQGLGAGLNGDVRALAVAATGDVWVGGNFNDAGGNPTADFVARWTGTSWQGLGTGVNNTVAALAVAGPGEVWVGGFFENAGGNANADFVARWNGTSWQALGTAAVNGPVEALAAAGPGKVYAGSYFTNAGGNANADHVARWDGTAWQALGTGLNDQVKALAAGPAGQLYAGGDFTTVGDGSKTLNRFAIHYAPSLVVSTAQLVPGGAYHNVTVTETGIATLSGDISISGELRVQTGGVLKTRSGGSCAVITGPGEFILESGTQLNICSPDGIAYEDPSGNVLVTGYRDYGYDAKFVYDGATAQFTGDGLYGPRELEIANPAGVTLSTELEVYQALRLTSGVLHTAGQPLVLNSYGYPGYGEFAAYVVHAGGTTDGNVTVQRHLAAGAGPSYHHLSSPVQAAPVSDLATSGFTPKVNAAYNALPTPNLPAASFPNIFGYDEARGGLTPAYQGFGVGYFSPATLGTTLTPGRGYSVSIAPDLTPDFVGALTTGPVNVALSHTGVNTASNKAGWHLLGNPYAQPIDWDLLATPAGVQAAVYVWYSAGGSNGAYRTRNASGVGSLTNGLIGIGQGFFVRTTAAATFPFTNALRVESDTVALGRALAATAPRLTLTLAQTGRPAAEADALTVYEQAGATPGFDGAFDAARPAPNVGLPTLSALINGEEALISALPEGTLTTGTTVELTLTLPAVATYALTAAELTNLPGAILLDRLTNTRYDLTTQPTVAFAAAQPGVVAGRFALVFGQRVLGTSDLAPRPSHLLLFPNPATGGGVVSVYGGPASQPVAVFDLAGRRVATVAADAQGTATLPVGGLVPGVYSVRTIAGRTARLVIE